MRINSYDIDGVIYMGTQHRGIRPHDNDVIITGRSVEESKETLQMLRKNGINNQVYFNPLPVLAKTRITSGRHKADMILALQLSGYDIGIHFDDDPVQISEIKKVHPYLNVVHLVNELVPL